MTKLYPIPRFVAATEVDAWRVAYRFPGEVVTSLESAPGELYEAEGSAPAFMALDPDSLLWRDERPGDPEPVFIDMHVFGKVTT